MKRTIAKWLWSFVGAFGFMGMLVFGSGVADYPWLILATLGCMGMLVVGANKSSKYEEEENE